MSAWVYVPGAVLVLVVAGLARGLLSLQRRVAEHAERIAHLEGERDADHR